MKIKNVICDIDGVLLHDNTPVPGADLFWRASGNKACRWWC